MYACAESVCEKRKVEQESIGVCEKCVCAKCAGV